MKFYYIYLYSSRDWRTLENLNGDAFQDNLPAAPTLKFNSAYTHTHTHALQLESALSTATVACIPVNSVCSDRAVLSLPLHSARRRDNEDDGRSSSSGRESERQIRPSVASIPAAELIAGSEMPACTRV